MPHFDSGGSWGQEGVRRAQAKHKGMASNRCLRWAVEVVGGQPFCRAHAAQVRAKELAREV
jgi:hypothetical protein